MELCEFVLILKGVVFYFLFWIINDELGGMEMMLMVVWDFCGKCISS